ncbi:unnamed protein product [Trichobilharzia regenti]|nr:unnamed protein product [Trichobilharzia regenti]
MIGSIINSTFEQHQHGVIWVDNSNDDILKSQFYRHFPVDYTISYNEFMHNQGAYVIHSRLTESSKLQHLNLMYNKFLNNR